MKVGRANLPGQHGGIYKLRPVVMIDDSKGFPPGSTVEVVVVTTTTDDKDGIYVELPWHPQGTASTKLRELSFANANWIVQVAVEELPESDGGIERARRLGPRRPSRIGEERRVSSMDSYRVERSPDDPWHRLLPNPIVSRRFPRAT
jgi:mRNA-degrading endonuclease toxin of MazEF toxin-antitoxin module